MARGKKKETLTLEERLQAALVPESERPYPVPRNWCWTYIKSGFDVTSSKRVHKSDWLSQGIPFYRTRELVKLSKNGYVDNELFISEKLYNSFVEEYGVPQEGDLLISGVGTIGVPYVINENQKFYFKDGNIIWFKNRGLFHPQYVYFLYKSAFIDNQIHQMSSGTTVDTYTIINANATVVPLPPFSEQQRIVNRIESLFAKLDEAKQKAQDALDSFETRKAAILHKAFSGELTAQWRKEHGVGMESWKALTLDDIAEYKKGPFGSSITKAMFVPKGNHTYKVYEQGNAIRKTVDYGHYYISEQKYLELKNFAVKSDDIIISCAGTIGEVFKLPKDCEPGIINQALMRVRIFSNIKEQYFIYYFGEILKGDVIDKANGTAIKNIPPFKIMKAMKIELPSLPEQTEIVRILDNLLTKEQQAKEAAEAVLEQIDLIKKSILVRAFRGELGTNDPNEESAVELLKQIL